MLLSYLQAFPVDALPSFKRVAIHDRTQKEFGDDLERVDVSQDNISHLLYLEFSSTLLRVATTTKLRSGASQG